MTTPPIDRLSPTQFIPALSDQGLSTEERINALAKAVVALYAQNKALEDKFETLSKRVEDPEASAPPLQIERAQENFKASFERLPEEKKKGAVENLLLKETEKNSPLSLHNICFLGNAELAAEVIPYIDSADCLPKGFSPLQSIMEGMVACAAPSNQTECAELFLKRWPHFATVGENAPFDITPTQVALCSSETPYLTTKKFQKILQEIEAEIAWQRALIIGDAEALKQLVSKKFVDAYDLSPVKVVLEGLRTTPPKDQRKCIELLLPEILCDISPIRTLATEIIEQSKDQPAYEKRCEELRAILTLFDTL